MLSCKKAFWQAVCGTWKASLACACRRLKHSLISLAASVLACVSETTIGGLSVACTQQKTMLAGRCAWIKLCIGSLLLCPFSVSLCYLSTSTFPPHPPLPPKGSFWEIMAITIAHIVCFCEVRMGLCVSLHIHCAQLFTDWLWESLRGAETGGWVQVVSGSTMDRWSTKQAKM